MDPTVFSPHTDELAGHDFYFISHSEYERRISCDASGKLKMQTTRKGWEVWRLVKRADRGSFLITSWVHEEKVLCSNAKGGVHTSDKKELPADGALVTGEWRLSRLPGDRGVRITSAEHGRCLAFNDKDMYTMDQEDHSTWHLEPALRHLNMCHPCMEAADRELCFISHPKYDRRLSCDSFGKLRMYKAWKGWEVWRFTRVANSGNFVISSWTHEDKVLCSNRDGVVYTTSKKKLLDNDGNPSIHSTREWFISLHPTGRGVRIQSIKHAQFLALSNHDLCTTKKEGDTAWYLEPAHHNHFFVSSPCCDKRLSSTNDDKVVIHRNRKPWEKWVVEPTNDIPGQFTILSLKHGNYLGSLEDGKLIVGESKHRWIIGSSPHGGVFIRSAKHGGWLSFDTDGFPFISTVYASWETWRLEPIMPIKISGKQIWCLVGAGVVTITLSVAIPFAVMGVVGAMGFGVEGIAVGSMAAGMMSAEAIAAGGGVAAGGTVATLQTIGAVGLGAAGAGAAAGTGAVAGGLASLGVIAANTHLNNTHEGRELQNPAEHLPLCSWRMWSGLVPRVSQ